MVSNALAELADEASRCTRCRLHETRTQVVFGVGAPEADLMFIGEAPGENEDLKGEPFVGRSGQLLDKLVLEEMGLTRDSFYIANVVKSRPPGNRDPRPDEIEACTPWLISQIQLIKPKVIVTLGNFSSRFVLKTTEGITKLRGQSYEWQGAHVVPTFHPAAALQGGGAETIAMMRADLVRANQLMGQS